MRTIAGCPLSNSTETCPGPRCDLFSKCLPDTIPCPKCLKDILQPLEAEGDYQCLGCGAVLYSWEPSYPKSEQEYIDWQ